MISEPADAMEMYAWGDLGSLSPDPALPSTAERTYITVIPVPFR